jgi:hypothetical protein
MAGIWTVEIAPVDRVTRTVNVLATVVDPDGRTFTIARQNVSIATAAARTAALDDLHAIFLSLRNQSIEEETYIGDLEAQAKANLEARAL